jgi:hypothetical protein
MSSSAGAREDGGELDARRGASRVAGALVCLALAAYWTLSIRPENAWGWDETMHVGTPAWRMLLAARGGDFGGVFDALHDCTRYPFVYPVVVAVWQGIFGATEASARVLSTLVWCLCLWGVFLLAREVAARESDGQRARRMPWIALGLAATCPLALSFAGTLMLEIPAVCVSVFALRAWVRREGANEAQSTRQRALAAGAWLCAAFFTKFNYGAVLGVALAFDHACDGVGAARRGELRDFGRRTAWLALLPALALAWWFVLPLPFGLARGGVHRSEFIDWITGNQSGAATDWKRRTLNVATSFAFNPRALLVLLVGIVASRRDLAKPAVRALAIACAVLAVAILAHPFHLPRFLIPVGAALWPLSAVGWSRLLPKSRAACASSVVALVLAVAIAPGADTMVLADKLGFLSDKPDQRAYQESVLAGYRDLRGSRHIQSAGLELGQAHQFLDLVARAVQPDERVGWIDLTEEISPAGLQFGLWQRGGSAARTLAQLPEKNYLPGEGADPKWSDAQLAEFAARYGVLLFTEPHSLKGKKDREFFASYVQRLEAMGWKRERIGEVSFPRPMQQPPLPIAVFTLRSTEPGSNR